MCYIFPPIPSSPNRQGFTACQVSNVCDCMSVEVLTFRQIQRKCGRFGFWQPHGGSGWTRWLHWWQVVGFSFSVRSKLVQSNERLPMKAVRLQKWNSVLWFSTWRYARVFCPAVPTVGCFKYFTASRPSRPFCVALLDCMILCRANRPHDSHS